MKRLRQSEKGKESCLGALKNEDRDLSKNRILMDIDSAYRRDFLLNYSR